MTDSDDGGSEKSAAMACGRVVGILQRNWRDYVVSLPEELEVKCCDNPLQLWVIYN